MKKDFILNNKVDMSEYTKALELIEKSKYKLDKDSVILLEQIRTLDKNRLKEKLTYLSEKKMKEVNIAIDISLGLHNIRNNKSYT